MNRYLRYVIIGMGLTCVILMAIGVLGCVSSKDLILPIGGWK